MNKNIDFNGNNYRIEKKMGNSYSSEVYKVASRDDTYILKIPYNDFAYDTEKMVLQELQKNNFKSPKIVGEINVFEKKGILMSFVRGPSADDIVLTKKIIKNIVGIMNDFHNIRIDNNSIQKYDYDVLYEKYTNNMKIIPNYVDEKLCCEICKRSNMFFALLKKQDYNSLVHRDLRLSNILTESEELFLIDFEGCAIGNPVMDLVKIYCEIMIKNEKLADYFMTEYLNTNYMDKKQIFDLLEAYTLLDKINTIVWCVCRKREESDFMKDTIHYLERKLTK